VATSTVVLCGTQPSLNSKKNGKVLVTSKQVAEATDLGPWVATGAFAKANPAFLKSFSGVIDKHTQSFLKNKAAWGP